MLRAVGSATALIFIAILLGLLLAGVLGGSVYGVAALLRHLAKQ